VDTSEHQGDAVRRRPWEARFESAKRYANPFQVRLELELQAPSGKRHRVDGFWDGDSVWRARFAPDEAGLWQYATFCSDESDGGLHSRAGSFECADVTPETIFDRHGPVQIAPSRTYLEHEDGTPFFWLADTGWNAALRAADDEFAHYLQVRAAQGFTAIQWVTTQWIAAPDGDIEGGLAYTGGQQIAVNPAFFQRLDRRVAAMNAAGLLSAPVMLWAATWIGQPEVDRVNPGVSLPVDQAILLCRYMLARWGAYNVLWIINGDGDYRGERAERWRQIGRAVFGERPHAPVTLHPGGQQMPIDEFAGETWLDINGYQSGHGFGEGGVAWLLTGPPTSTWQRTPLRPMINLEPPYEGHLNMGLRDGSRLSEHNVRQAMYSSLLLAPTAGVTYGGHGVWGWDDGTTTPVAHPATGVPLPWREALRMPAAEQLEVMAAAFGSLSWWSLRPAQEIIAAQPTPAIKEMAVAARDEAGTQAALYTPTAHALQLDLTSLSPGLPAVWVNPRDGARHDAGTTEARAITLTPPGEGDWLLMIGAGPASDATPA
jgi:hypothetical protein